MNNYGVTDNRPKAQTSVIVYACIGAFLGQSAYFIHLPSLLQMEANFSVDAAAMQNSITVYALSYGFSQLLWGPCSDRFGRKPVAIAGMGLFIVTSFAIGLTETYGWFQLLRLIQGVGAGCGTSVSRAALRDVLASAKLAQATSYVSICFAGALGIAPFVGGQFARWLSWKFDFIFLAILGILSLLYLIYSLPETHRLESATRTSNFNLSLINNYLEVLFNPQFLLPALICAIVTGMISLYDTVSPFDLEKSLGLTPTQFGNTSLAITLAYLVGAILVNRKVIALGQRFFLRLGLCLILFASGVMLVLGLAGIFNVYSLLLPMVLVVVGCGMVIPVCFALSLNPFPNQAGLASALIGVVQQEGTALIVFLAAYISNNSQTPLALVLLVMGTLSLILVGYSRP